MIRNIAILGAGVLWFGSPAAAQVASPTRSFEELKLRMDVGETVYVVDSSGHETSGRVAFLSDFVLTLTVNGSPHQFTEAEVTRIHRPRKDSIRNGLLIGNGAGALVGFRLGRSRDFPSCPRSGIECGQGAVVGTVSGALWGTVAGWITDALVHKREILYLAGASDGSQTNRGQHPSKP